MTRFVSTDERVAFLIFDTLTEREGVSPNHAALVGQAALAEMRRDNNLPELFVVRVIDSSGDSHAVVMRELPTSDKVPLWRFDIRRMRWAIRQEIAVDLATNHAGTAI